MTIFINPPTSSQNYQEPKNNVEDNEDADAVGRGTTIIFDAQSRRAECDALWSLTRNTASKLEESNRRQQRALDNMRGETERRLKETEQRCERHRSRINNFQRTHAFLQERRIQQKEQDNNDQCSMFYAIISAITKIWGYFFHTREVE